MLIPMIIKKIRNDATLEFDASGMAYSSSLLSVSSTSSYENKTFILYIIVVFYNIFTSYGGN